MAERSSSALEKDLIWTKGLRGGNLMDLVRSIELQEKWSDIDIPEMKGMCHLYDLGSEHFTWNVKGRHSDSRRQELGSKVVSSVTWY